MSKPGVDLEAAIHDMSSDYIQCRDFGHQWRSVGATWVAADNRYETSLRCIRCGTDRIRYIGRDGGLMRSKYDYSDGYVVKGMGRLDGHERDMIRLESVLRVLDTSTEAPVKNGAHPQATSKSASGAKGAPKKSAARKATGSATATRRSSAKAAASGSSARSSAPAKKTAAKKTAKAPAKKTAAASSARRRTSGAKKTAATKAS